MRFWATSFAALFLASSAFGVAETEDIGTIRKTAPAYRHVGDMARALPLYKKWAALEKDAAVWEETADVCAVAGDYESARFHYKKALREAVRRGDGPAVRRLRKRVTSLPADFGLIERLIDRENYAEAFRHLKTRLNLNPGDSTALTLMGAVYEAIGQNNPAERLYRKAVSVAPKNPAPHYYLGRFYLLKKKKFEEALKELKLFRSLMGGREKGLVQATRWIASVEATTLGRPEEAFSEIETLVQSGRADAETLYEYGVLALKLDRRRTAYEAFQKVIRMKPDSEIAAYAQEAIEAIRSLPAQARYGGEYS